MDCWGDITIVINVQDDNCGFFYWENDMSINMLHDSQQQILNQREELTRINIERNLIARENVLLEEKIRVLENNKKCLEDQIEKGRITEIKMYKMAFLVSFFFLIISLRIFEK